MPQYRRERVRECVHPETVATLRAGHVTVPTSCRWARSPKFKAQRNGWGNCGVGSLSFSNMLESGIKPRGSGALRRQTGLRGAVQANLSWYGVPETQAHASTFCAVILFAKLHLMPNTRALHTARLLARMNRRLLARCGAEGAGRQAGDVIAFEELMRHK